MKIFLKGFCKVYSSLGGWWLVCKEIILFSRRLGEMLEEKILVDVVGRDI